jgi:hypothetical protein
MGRPQARHPSAFLVNQDWCIGAPNAIAERLDQGANLCRVLYIALKQDQPEGIAIAEKSDFICREGRSTAAENDRRRMARCTSSLGGQ